MTPNVLEWIDKAESDFRVARRERLVREGPSYDVVCFLCQLSIEKYLKGYLELNEIDFTKTHLLTTLLDITLPLQPLWESWRRAFRIVSDYAVGFRYPGEHAEQYQAEHAYATCQSFRAEIRQILNLPD